MNLPSNLRIFVKNVCVVNRYIQNLIDQGEHQKLDFKFEISDVKKIARTFSAFANTDGGTLLIGVKDNGNISGVKADEEAYMIESSAEIYCSPKVDYEIKPHKIHDKTVLEVIIPESKNKPHRAPWKDSWKAFVRVGDQNFLANSVIFETWKNIYQKKDLLVRYDNYEELLFDLLKKKEEISLQDFIDCCKIKPYLAIKILAKLITVEVLDYRITENETYYFSKEFV